MEPRPRLCSGGRPLFWATGGQYDADFQHAYAQKGRVCARKRGQGGHLCLRATVYNYFHIGNARPFIIFDTLRRFLKHIGYDVTFVQNFTDIDDKMIRRAHEENTTVDAIAEKYIAEYFKDAEVWA